MSETTLDEQIASLGLDQHGTNVWPSHMHGLSYYIRDATRAWCEKACERGDMRSARTLAVRAERFAAQTQAYACTEATCALCLSARQRRRSHH